jgi:hypothetical protein
MTDIWEYKPIIDFIDHGLLIKGHSNGDPKAPYHMYSIGIKVWPNLTFCAESSLSLFNENIEEFVNHLKIMHKETKGSAIINDEEFGSTISCSLDKYGRMLISGKLYSDDHRGTFLNFEIDSDQTTIPSLIAVFEELISV